MESLSIGNTQVGYDELVDYKTASKILGVAPRTIQNWTWLGKLPTYHISKRKNLYWVRELIDFSESKITPARKAA